jgi:3,4-dihydroxy-2-butanone 4-phosphate synthase
MNGGHARDPKEGCPVIVVDDGDRENEGDIVRAAQYVTQERIARTDS